MKIFHFKDKVDSLPKNVDKILPPVHIRLKPTNVCNHNCSYCGYRKSNLQLGKDMTIRDFIPKEKMMEIIGDLSDMGVKSVTFSGGGEPLCYPFMLDTAKKLANSPVKFATLTNGSRLHGEVAEIFAKHATWVRISIDGWDDESYSKYRGVASGEFTKVMKNIENFKNLGGSCYLGVSIIIDKDNAPHINEMVTKLKKAGVDSVKLAPCLLSDSGKECNEYHKPIFSLVKEQIAKSMGLANNNFEIFDSYHDQLMSHKKDYKWCPYLQIVPVIGADMNVYSCRDKAYNIKEGLLGSIKNQRFKDFWFSDKNKFFNINPSVHCNNHCMVNAHNKLILDYLNADKEHLEFV